MSVDEEFRGFIDKIFRTILDWHPTLGTFLGLHEYDPYMDDFSRGQVLREIRQVEKWLEELMGFDLRRLNHMNRVDWEILRRDFEIELFMNRDLKLWERVNNLGEIVMSAIYLLFVKDFAPFEQRLGSIISRLTYTEKIARDLKERCTRPVKTWSKIASEVTSGTIGFLKLIEHTARSMKVSEDILDKYMSVEERSINVLVDFKKYLDEEIIPEAPDDWAIGRENLIKLLRLRGIKESLDEILAMAERVKAETMKEIEKIGNELYPGLSIREILDKVREEYPKTPEEVLEAYRKAIHEAREILRKTGLVPLPEDEDLKVIRTPKPLIPLLP